MFTKSKTKLDRAVILSVLAMIACTMLITTQQLNTVPRVAVSPSAPAQQT